MYYYFIQNVTDSLVALVTSFLKFVIDTEEAATPNNYTYYCNNIPTKIIIIVITR